MGAWRWTRGFAISILAAALPLAAIPSSCRAGLNAGATAKISWVTSRNGLSGTRNDNSCTPRFVITARGIASMRGANCQVEVYGMDGSLPESWQFWADEYGAGGCASNASSATIARSGFPAGVTSAWSLVPNVADGQASMYYNQGNCLTPRGSGLIWLESAGSDGVSRSPGAEYGLYTVTVDQSLGSCSGDCRNGSSAVCLVLTLHDPCPVPSTTGNKIQLLDRNDEIDVASVSPGYEFLTWNGAGDQRCPPIGSGGTTSWAHLRRTYR